MGTVSYPLCFTMSHSLKIPVFIPQTLGQGTAVWLPLMESSHYFSFPTTPPGRQVVVHDYLSKQSVKIMVLVSTSVTVTSEPRPVPSLAQLSRFRPEDIPADAVVTPVAPLTDTKLIAALVSTTSALPAYSPVRLLPPTSVSSVDPPPWYRPFVVDAVSAFRAQLPGLPPVSAVAPSLPLTVLMCLPHWMFLLPRLFNLRLSLLRGLFRMTICRLRGQMARIASRWVPGAVRIVTLRLPKP